MPPATVTASLNVTVSVDGGAGRQVPLAGEVVTAEIVGATVSICSVPAGL